MTNEIPRITLNNGVEMPVLGFGVYQIPAEQTEQAVTDALPLPRHRRLLPEPGSRRPSHRQKRHPAQRGVCHYQALDPEGRRRLMFQRR
jgi:hypothetical protein